ncbi:MAG: hypothetical protein E7Z90_00710 [Cyanobacteria bacterium SIG29]|nr:hypothetical protein [Cyanobacteria bacterium SIG29]
MKKKIKLIFCLSFALIFVSANVVLADYGYEKSISIGGTNNVHYDYKVIESPKEEKKEIPEEVIQIKRINVWDIYRPYHNPMYYHSHSPMVYTYSGTGIKSGPGGQLIHPSMERNMHNPPPRPHYRPNEFIQINRPHRK